MERKRTIKATDITRDIRSGMTIPQLIEKYNISLNTLRLVFRRLLKAGRITREELNSRAALYSDAADLESARSWLRTTTTFPARIYDSSSTSATGYIGDISEKGVCVKGIETVVGEVKNFIVRSDAFGQGQKFVFEAKCRWMGKEKLLAKKWMAGFEITDISSLDLAELRKLIRYVDEQYFERPLSEPLEATFGVIY